MNEDGTEVQSEDQRQEDNGSNQKEYNLDTAVEKIRELREEAKQHRLKAQEASTERDEFKTKFEELTSKVSDFESQITKFADYDEVKTGFEKVKQENQNLKLEVQLTGKVIDVKKAMKLVDESYITDEGLDVTRFLEENSFLATKATVTNPASNKSTVKTSGSSIDDLSKMSPDDIEKFFANHKPQV